MWSSAELHTGVETWAKHRKTDRYAEPQKDSKAQTPLYDSSHNMS